MATIADRIEYVTMKLPAPKRRGFLRPTVSSIKVIKLCESYKTKKPRDDESLQEVCDGSSGTIYTLDKEGL